MKICDQWTGDNLPRLETIYHTANGYLGVRACPEEGQGPGSIRGQYLNGVYETLPIVYGEKLYGFPEEKQTICNVPDAQTLHLTADGKFFSMFAPEVTDRAQSLDLHEGILRRSCLWDTGRGKLAVRFTRLASFELPNLFLLDCEVKSGDFAGHICLESDLVSEVRNFADASDPRVAAEPLRCFRTLQKDAAGEMGRVLCETLQSKIQVALCAGHTGMDGAWEETETGLRFTAEADILPGETVHLAKFAVYTDSLREQAPLEAAAKKLRMAMQLGLEHYLEAQRTFVSEKARETYVTIEAPAPLPEAMEYDQYALIESVCRDGTANVAAKGLSGEGYEGHTFWDSEIYVFPYFLWTQPETARRMLTWRYRLLPKARENARLAGLAGALYPWRTISGSECSAFFPAGTAQYHIDGDIAHAFLEYWRVTDDLPFMAEMGAEVLVETARMFYDLGHFEDGRFRIDCVTGPDEYTCCVNNNFYTNAVARQNLQGAAEVMRALEAAGLDRGTRERCGVTEKELEGFADAARAMLLPYDQNLGISMQDDSFLKKKRLDFKSLPKSDFPLLLHYHPLFLYRHQVCKQADTVLAHLLFPDTADELTQRRSFDYYDAVTTHDSSLSECVFATQAARLGMLQRAGKGFADTALLDLGDTHGNTKDGLHTASLGGTYLAMLVGLAGVRAGEVLSLDPVLPPDWTGYTLPIRYRGRSLLLTVSEKEKSLTLQSGKPLPVRLSGTTFTLEGHLTF